MEEEVEILLPKCDKCQRYGNNIHRPAELLHPVVAPWPFMKWGMDIVDPLPQSKGKIRFLLVLIDYFTKWVEVGAFKQGAEALISVEIGDPSTRYTQATKESNEEEMRVNLDLFEERGGTALIRMAAQKQVIERYYNRKAHLRYFKIGDYVLKKVFQSTRADNAGKLSPDWEGPYKIRGIAGKGAYELETLDGKILPSS
ncbi:uncharacterized protein LOC142176091 [Nicotiana tabacum]|uniref:Uncharacterized protein LOC142176091 n=1 Tax=Nicotiana tabacum TaxID=4097 RepID=A0AC58TPV9_TOBAC